MPDKFAPARYIGNHVVDLQQTRRDWRNIDGSKRTEMVLTNGDTVMMPAEEVLGMTLWHDPQRQKRSIKVGIGRCVLKEDAGKTIEELKQIGYEFHQGRPDFEPLETEPPAQNALPVPEPVTESIEVEESQILESVPVQEESEAV